MNAGRYVVLGLGLPRSAWFRNVAQWATGASIPVEFVKCMSTEELRARLQSGRAWSAVLVDAAVPSLDRDLIDEARALGSAVIVVDDIRVQRDWSTLMPDAVINPLFSQADLVETLGRCANEVSRADDVPGNAVPSLPAGWRARVAMVCGPGGTGTSTVSIALAQGLGDEVRYGGMVLLADFARRAEQAMLHDARDIVPGIQEVVDAHRGGRPSIDDVQSLTLAIVNRRYQLLLGLRRPSAWSTLRPRAFAAAVDSLRRGWRVIVCDTDCDLEGEDEGGSTDVEDRNLMARSAAGLADAVFVVGHPGVKGIHSLVRCLHELRAFGVESSRLIPVINRAPRAPRAKAELARALADLTGDAPISPVFLPDRAVDDVVRDGVRFPAQLSSPLVGAFHAVLDAAGGRVGTGDQPERVTPGTLGSWTESRP